MNAEAKQIHDIAQVLIVSLSGRQRAAQRMRREPRMIEEIYLCQAQIDELVTLQKRLEE